MNTEDMIKDFLAKGGTIRKIETGLRAMDERDMRDLAHGTDAKREAVQARTQTEDGYAKFEREQQEAWLARHEGWTE